jgi:hypothetical protein
MSAGVLAGALALAPATAAPPPARSCVICCDCAPEKDLVRPCRSCATDYCKECLASMFTSAVTDATRMPPRCCTYLQLHVAIDKLSEHDIKAYRAKFEEWLTKDKTYCPSPKCSAFIPERTIPALDELTVTSLHSTLSDLYAAVSQSHHARFFQGPPPYAQSPEYTKTVSRPMDLSVIKAKISSYTATNELTADLKLIVDNTIAYYAPRSKGKEHPVTQTARKLLEVYLTELSGATDRLAALAGKPRPRDHFTCPDCHIAICLRCKQIEHAGSPCDTTSQDEEMAMLEQFRYKRCPLCKHAVKKMYGCSHMQCVCGAHWCYYCQKSIHECDGSCEERDDSEEEDDDGDEDEDDTMHDSADLSQERDIDVSMAEPHPDGSAPGPASQQVLLPSTQGSQSKSPRLVNLDGGGSRRWADSGIDFGDEPEDDGREQIWCCSHSFDKFKAAEDEYNHGDLSRMECNKCFERVKPEEPAQPSVPLPDIATKKRTLMGYIKQVTKPKHQPAMKAPTLEATATVSTAWECRWCNIVLCETCRSNTVAKAGD